MIHPRTLKSITILLELKAACFDLLLRDHKLPALLNLYAFIDICAALSKERRMSNRETFESYLRRFSTWRWDRYTPYDLWAARSSLLHSYSPLGDHTGKPNGAKPIFYFARPETESQVRALLQTDGYRDFLVIDIVEIKLLAVDAFNALYRELEQDALFEAVFMKNAEHLLSDAHHLLLERELEAMKQVIDAAQRKGASTDG